MITVGLDDFRIAYSAIPRCANTSIKLALFKLSTGREFQGYIGDGPRWPHSTSKLEIHRNDIAEFTYLTENDSDLIESNYDFWFTIVDTPLRRLFSSYYMFVLLEDPHLTVMGRDTKTFPKLEEISYSSITAHFEDFTKSEYLRYLMEVDVHFIPQSNLLGNLPSSSKLRFYGLHDVAKMEIELNTFLLKNRIQRVIEVPKSNTSLLSVDNIDISWDCHAMVESLYKEDSKMSKARLTIRQNRKQMMYQKDERLMSAAVNEIRERNRRIYAIYERHKQ